MALHLGSSTTTPAKTHHYQQALSAALLSGSWGEKYPCKAPNGTQLDWHESVRKWSKHTGGSPPLILRLRDLSLLYLSTSPDPRQRQDSCSYTSSPHSTASQPSDGSDPISARSGVSLSTSTSSFIHVSHPSAPPQDGTKRQSLQDMRQQEKTAVRGQGGEDKGTTSEERHSVDVAGRSPPEAATSTATTPAYAYLSAPDLDGDDDEAYALRDAGGWWAGIGPERVVEVEAGLKDVEALLAGGKLKGRTEMRTAQLIRAYHLHALGRHDAALAVYREIDWSSPTDQQGGLTIQAQAADLVRARCLQGMSYELATTSQPESAIAAYQAVLSVLPSIPAIAVPSTTFLTPLPAAKPGGAQQRGSASLTVQSSTACFESHREVFRWISVALCRGAILTARTNDNESTLRFLRTYHLFARLWPANFKPKQRSLMLNLYMHALHASYPASRSVLPDKSHQWFLFPRDEIVVGTLAEVWSREVRQVMQQGKELLSVTTTFPRAGEVNVAVEGFLNACVALWQKGGGRMREGLDVVQILWWAMSLTFHSQPLLRHLTRLLQATKSPAEAKRTFELYVQLVLKSRQTSQPELALQLQQRPTEDGVIPPAELAKQAAAVDHPSDTSSAAQQNEVVQDSDEHVLEALLVGIRLLTKDLADPSEAWRYAVLAGEVIEQGQGRIGMKLKAKVEAGKGIVRVAMALQEMDPDTRPTWQAQGIDHLVAATLMDPSSASIYYHLAYARAEARDIEQATFSIRRSLELDPRNVEAWHLLALLLTAQKEWGPALKAVGAGIQMWETIEDEQGDGVLQTVAAADPAINERDFGATSQTPVQPAGTFPSTQSTRPLITGRHLGPLPSPTASASIYPPPSASLRLSIVIQLKMTEAVITEKLYGHDQALQKQQESFAFFSARSGYARVGGGGVDGGGSVRSGTLTGTGTAKDLEAGYVAVADQGQPVPGTSAGGEGGMTPAPPIINAPSTDASSPPPDEEDSPERSVAGSDPEADVDGQAEAGAAGASGSGGRRQKFLPKHLHVPGKRLGRTPSMLRSRSPGGDRSVQRTRTISDGSSLFSRNPTPAHSHYHGARSPPAAPPPVALTGPGRAPTGRTREETRVLSNLWLSSAATFRRSGRAAQALVAIQEAEVLDPENEDVWVQLGLYHVENQSPKSEAINSFTKALLLRSEYPPAVINLSILYFHLSELDMAHGLLNALTQSIGWDVPEAFLWLARVCERQGRRERAGDLARFALMLERTRTCRPIHEVVARWL